VPKRREKLVGKGEVSEAEKPKKSGGKTEAVETEQSGKLKVTLGMLPFKRTGLVWRGRPPEVIIGTEKTNHHARGRIAHWTIFTAWRRERSRLRKRGNERISCKWNRL